MKVGVPSEVKTDEYRVANDARRASASWSTPATEVFIQSGAGEGSSLSRRGLRRPGRDDPARRGRGVRRGDDDRQGQGAAARGGGSAAAAPRAVHLPAPGGRGVADAEG